VVLLTTPRLVLRECAPDDLAAFHELDADPEVVRYVSYGPWTLEESRHDLDVHIAQQAVSPRLSYYLAVVLKAEARLIGWCALDITSQKHHEAELGYALNRRSWGQGYSTEAAQALLAFGFGSLDLHRVFATCSPENVASERVLQKLGMQQEGRLRENKWSKGRWRDSLLYAILADEWRAAAGAAPKTSQDSC
jgi:ribosomal-protein-alanine N-acetyltransferase